MKKFLYIFMLFGFFSCTDSTSECINDMMDEFKKLNQDRGFTFIKKFEQDGETFYIFDSGIAFDATASIVNNECETVCTYGGFRVSGPAICEEFQEGINNATQIWPE